MSGFFGFFDYGRPGKGIDKNGPQKNRFFLFFELFFRKFWKFIKTNVLFVVSIAPFAAVTTILAYYFPDSPLISIIAVLFPFMTIGPASAGFTKILRNFALEQPVFIISDYFDTIKKNWKQALLVSFINTLIGFLLFYALYFYYFETKGLLGYLLIGLGLFALICYLFMQYYLYLMVVTFKFKIKQLYKNAFILSLAALTTNLITTFFLALIWAGLALLFLIGPLGFSISIFLMITIAFAFSGFIIVYNSFPHIKKLIIDPYYKEQNGTNEQEDNDNTSEQIFTDIGKEE